MIRVGLCLLGALTLAGCSPGRWLRGPGDDLSECLAQPVGPRGDPAPSPLSQRSLGGAVVLSPGRTHEGWSSGATLATLPSIATSLVLPVGLTAGDPAQRPTCCEEWAREFDLLTRAAVPTKTIALSAVDASHGGGVRVAVLEEDLDTVVAALDRAARAESARIHAATGRRGGRATAGPTADQDRAGPWTRLRYGVERLYCDYGGIAYVEFLARPLENATLVLVLAYRSGADAEPMGPYRSVVASVTVGGDVDLVGQGVALWEEVVARVSGLAREAVSARFRDLDARVETTTSGKWLEVHYVEEIGWARLAGTSRLPLLVFGPPESDGAPRDVPLGAAAVEALAASSSPLAAEIRLPRVLEKQAFASESSARQEFRRRFGPGSPVLVRLEHGEPALAERIVSRASLERCTTRCLSLSSGRAWTTDHLCSAPPR